MFNKESLAKGRGRGIAVAIMTIVLGTSVIISNPATAAPSKVGKAVATKSTAKPKKTSELTASRKSTQKKASMVKASLKPQKGFKASRGTQKLSAGRSYRKVAALAAGATAALVTVPASAGYQSFLSGVSGESGLRLDLPKLRSQAAFVLDMDSGMPLLSKHGNEQRPIASITKLMTAMVVLDAKLPLDAPIRVTDEDVDRVKFSSSRLAVGTELSRARMLKLALMSSENRAAHALGRTYPGGLGAFVKAMNAKAKELGLRNTRFQDPTGLDPDNVASPRDLAHMVAAASRYEKIREFSTDDAEVIRLRSQEKAFRNTNALVRQGDWDISVSKTGYIQEAGRCLVMQASVNNRKTLIVLLNSQDTSARTMDSLAIKRWLEQRDTQSALKAVDVLLTKTTTSDSENHG